MFTCLKLFTTDSSITSIYWSKCFKFNEICSHCVICNYLLLYTNIYQHETETMLTEQYHGNKTNEFYSNETTAELTQAPVATFNSIEFILTTHSKNEAKLIQGETVVLGNAFTKCFSTPPAFNLLTPVGNFLGKSL